MPVPFRYTSDLELEQYWLSVSEEASDLKLYDDSCTGSWQESVDARPPIAQSLLQAPLKLDWTQPSPLQPLTDPNNL